MRWQTSYLASMRLERAKACDGWSVGFAGIASIWLKIKSCLYIFHSPFLLVGALPMSRKSLLSSSTVSGTSLRLSSRQVSVQTLIGCAVCAPSDSRIQFPCGLKSNALHLLGKNRYRHQQQHIIFPLAKSTLLFPHDVHITIHLIYIYTYTYEYQYMHLCIMFYDLWILIMRI